MSLNFVCKFLLSISFAIIHYSLSTRRCSNNLIFSLYLRASALYVEISSETFLWVASLYTMAYAKNFSQSGLLLSSLMTFLSLWINVTWWVIRKHKNLWYRCMVKSIVCFLKPNTFSFFFPFDCVSVITDQEKKSNSRLMLTVFSCKTISMNNFSSSTGSKALTMLFEREQILYWWLDIIVIIMLGVHK